MIVGERTFNYKLTKKNILDILNKNFSFEIVEDEVYGEMIRMPPRDAFVLSLVHGAPYLVNEVGYSLKGRFEVLIHRAVFQNNKYIYTPGLFGRNIERKICAGNSPYYVKRKYPQIFEKYKNILFVDIPKNSSSNIEGKVFQNLKSRTDPSNYLLLKVFEGGSNLEPFFEFISCLYYNKLGYLTENQVPWFQQKFDKNGKNINGGIPDFSAFKIPFFNVLHEKGILNKGMVIQELSSLFLFDKNSTEHDFHSSDYKYELIIGEVKTSNSQKKQMLKQLEQYIETELCNKAYGILYDENQVLKNNIGVINIDENFRINVMDGPTMLSVDHNMQKNDEIWLKNYSKFYILGNLPYEKISKFITNRRKSKGMIERNYYYSYDLIDAVVDCPCEELIEFVSTEVEE